MTWLLCVRDTCARCPPGLVAGAAGRSAASVVLTEELKAAAVAAGASARGMHAAPETQQVRGGSFLMSEACPWERIYVGLLRVAGARATRRGGVEPRARTDDAPPNPRGCWGPVGDGR
jgi:hypothetical protein